MPDNAYYETKAPRPVGTRPHLLFLSHVLPYPPDHGASIRTYHLMRLLSREFRITALCFFRRQLRPTPADVQRAMVGLRDIATTSAYPIPQDESPLRLVWDHVRSVLQRRVYTRFALDSSGFDRELDRLVNAGSIDLVHVDSMDLGAYIPKVSTVPVVCGHHNVESSLLRRRAAATRSPAARLYLNYQAHLMEKLERELTECCPLNVAVSTEDRARFAEIAPGAAFIVVPNGVDTEWLKPSVRDEAGLVFVGGHGWQPNRDAMEYFCSTILPIVRRRHPSVSVSWVGRTPDRVRRRYTDRYGVRVAGYVDDIRPYVHAAACFIVPIRMGGGTRLKILDAWAMGKAVVSTSIGCEGLDARDGENILIRDDPVQYADAIDQVLRDQTFRRRLGEQGRRTAEERYDWEVVGRPMLQAYRELVEPEGNLSSCV